MFSLGYIFFPLLRAFWALMSTRAVRVEAIHTQSRNKLWNRRWEQSKVLLLLKFNYLIFFMQLNYYKMFHIRKTHVQFALIRKVKVIFMAPLEALSISTIHLQEGPASGRVTNTFFMFFSLKQRSPL